MITEKLANILTEEALKHNLDRAVVTLLLAGLSVIVLKAALMIVVSRGLDVGDVLEG